MNKKKKALKVFTKAELLFFLLIVLAFSAAVYVYLRRADGEAETALAQAQQAAAASEAQGTGFAAHYIDVGQGDCELLISGGESMLIDAGEADEAEKVIKYIKDLGITELTYVVATHPHSDHIGGLPAVIGSFTVKNFIAPDIAHTTKTFENLLDVLERKNIEITVAVPFDEYALGGSKLTVLWPDGNAYESMNDYSVILRADYGETSFLFTGDAEKTAENAILETRASLKSDILKVGHHGSRTSTSSRFLEEVSPRAAVISCGLDNTYDHPHESIIDKLNKKGIDIYQTHLNGTIVINSDGKSFEIETEK